MIWKSRTSKTKRKENAHTYTCPYIQSSSFVLVLPYNNVALRMYGIRPTNITWTKEKFSTATLHTKDHHHHRIRYFHDFMVSHITGIANYFRRKNVLFLSMAWHRMIIMRASSSICTTTGQITIHLERHRRALKYVDIFLKLKTYWI